MQTLAPNPNRPQASHDCDGIDERRAFRYRALEWLRSRTCREGGRTCMHGTGTTVSIAATSDGVVHVGGVQRCSSPWACLVCAPTIGERRAVEIDQAVTAWRSMGGEVYFVTATMRHTAALSLTNGLDRLQWAWSRTVRQGLNPHAWYGGQIRAVEVTYGEANGWHPHVHAAVFIEPGWDAAEWAYHELVALGRTWDESLRLVGGRAVVTPIRDRRTGRLVKPGWDVARVTDASSIAKYLSKVEGGWGIGLELARLDLKSGDGASPAELVRAAVLEGDRQAEALYLEYEKATTGRRRIVASPGLLDRCGVKELTDEEAAEAQLEEAPAALVLVPAGDWRRLLAAGFAATLLADVARLGRGESDGWPWPPGWLSTG